MIYLLRAEGAEGLPSQGGWIPRANQIAVRPSFRSGFVGNGIPPCLVVLSSSWRGGCGTLLDHLLRGIYGPRIVPHFYRAQFSWVLSVLVTLLLSGSVFAETESKGFEAVVQPFLSANCIKCHGPKKAKGAIRLDRIDGRISEGHDYETWTAIQGQLAEGEMPPEDEKQPTEGERAEVVAWIGGELEKARRSERVQELLNQFAYGNRVDHDKLFSGEITALPSSPPRLWRMNPNIYDRTKKRIFRDHWMELRRVRQPFPIENKPGINDYAADLFADSASLETLLRNARGIVEHQLTREVAEPLRLFLETEEPSKAQIEAVLRYQFATLVYRQPEPDELDRYRAFMTRAIAKSNVREGLRVGLKAIALSPEAVYRMELGLSSEDEHGRRRLAGVELAFALSFALTDDPPDEELVKVVSDGGLRSRAGVERQVKRLLDDDAIAKPKILRFFQEFFGYHRAPQVFKDAKRYENYDWGEVPLQLVHEADLLVLHILKEDREVLKQLLTTRKYFVGHIGMEGDATDLKARLAALQLLYAYWKGKPWEKLEYELGPKVRAEIEALHPYFRKQPMKHRMSGGLIKDYMRYLTICYQNEIRPMLAQFILMKGERERNLTSAHDHRYFLHAYNLQIDKFDCPVEQPFVVNKSERAGLLTHPAWLIAHSKNTDTNPITRGKWVRERLLAGHVPDVPITVNAVVPEDPAKTLRERFHATRQAECWRCHRKMNPLGMIFESYDDFGRHRTIDEVSRKPINATGELDATGDAKLDGKVENAVQLVDRLAQSDRVRQSFVRHAFRYWMGRNETLEDSATLRAADEAYLKSGGSFQALLVSLLASDSFLYRKEPAP